MNVQDINIGDLVSGYVGTSIVEGFVTFISLRGANLKLLDKNHVKYFFELRKDAPCIFIHRFNIISITKTQLLKE